METEKEQTIKSFVLTLVSIILIIQSILGFLDSRNWKKLKNLDRPQREAVINLIETKSKADVMVAIKSLTLINSNLSTLKNAINEGRYKISLDIIINVNGMIKEFERDFGIPLDKQIKDLLALRVLLQEKLKEIK